LTRSDSNEEDVAIKSQDRLTTDNNDQMDGGEYMSLQDRFMTWYSEILMRPWVKVFVILFFAGFFAGCSYSTSQLYQAFDASDLAPEDSYTRDFIFVWNTRVGRPFPVSIYFREVDQSDPEIQEQMRKYIDDIVAMPYMGRDPSFCWVTDWLEYSGMLSDELSFYEKLDTFLSIPQAMNVYGRDIVRDEKTGNILSSKCRLDTQNTDKGSIMDSIKYQINFLREQRRIGHEQSINEGLSPSDWPFFAFDAIFIMFEFYAVHVSELITTTIAGLTAVSVVAVFFLPHWSGVFFLLPTMIVVYIDLLGWIQFCGLHMNVITFIILVVSIGLLVDFILHILLCYYESTAVTREEKAKDSLQTLGPSILVGGLSTFLGVVLLAFSTSTVVRTVYICFSGMIIVGVSHGLMLLPVLLSLFGPVNYATDPELPIKNASSDRGIESLDTHSNKDEDVVEIIDAESDTNIKKVLVVNTDDGKSFEKVSIADTESDKNVESE